MTLTWLCRICLCAGLLLTFFDSSVATADTGAAAVRCLALTIYFEARGEPDLGKLAVAHVVMNRSHDTRFPASICDVARQQSSSPDRHCQFSWTCDDVSDHPTDGAAWQRSVTLAKAVYYGRSMDPTEGATFYHADYANPAWSHEMKPVLQIGHHLFYRSIARWIATEPAKYAPAKHMLGDQPPLRLPLRQLAEQIQQALAPNSGFAERINISVHVYSDDKAKRLVGIGDATYYEGDWLNGELRLVAITPRGIVVQRGSTQFGVPAW